MPEITHDIATHAGIAGGQPPQDRHPQGMAERLGEPRKRFIGCRICYQPIVSIDCTAALDRIATGF